MNMKTTFFVGIAMLANVSLFAQYTSTPEPGNIPITVVGSVQKDVPKGTNTFIENKLQQIISQNGLGSADYYGRFVITASFMQVTKDIVPGPPKQFVENLDVTFYIVDNIEQKIFSSTTVSVRAVDRSEEKVFNKAIRSINVKSPQMTSFVNEGREKIVNYYISQADRIIATAHSLARQRNYEAAFYELSTIPQACGAAYDKALAAGNVIYQEYVDYMCDVNLAKARSAWMAEQNSYAAYEAGEYLSKILPDAKCYGSAEALYWEIKAKVLDDWKFEMKKYNDQVSLEQARIDAWRQVGVAYGRNQKSDTYNVTWLVR